MKLCDWRITDPDKLPYYAPLSEWVEVLGLSRSAFYQARRNGTLSKGSRGYMAQLIFEREEIIEWYNRRLLTPATKERIEETAKQEVTIAETERTKAQLCADFKLAIALLNIRAVTRRLHVVLEPDR